MVLITFFIKGEYWRFNDRRFSIDFSRSNPFPRPTGTYLTKLLKKKLLFSGPWWFGCPKTRPLLDDGDNSVDVLTNLQFGYSEAEDEENYISFGVGDEDLDVDTNY